MVQVSMQYASFPLFLPDHRCIICQRTLEEIRGFRIVAQHFRGIIITDNPHGGGNKDYPRKCFKLCDTLFLCVWGSWWSEEVIERAIDAFHRGRRPWFCQLKPCGNRICVDCGSPLQQPVGSDVLYDDGRTAHVPILPCHPGCINPRCKNHKEAF